VAAGLLGAFALAAMAGLGLIAAGRATRKSQIPFGPFMLASAIAVIAASGLAGSHFP
jgi:leader peptidase (prepilin peptidase) / N-methyltransferase